LNHDVVEPREVVGWNRLEHGQHELAERLLEELSDEFGEGFFGQLIVKRLVLNRSSKRSIERALNVRQPARASHREARQAGDHERQRRDVPLAPHEARRARCGIDRFLSKNTTKSIRDGRGRQACDRLRTHRALLWLVCSNPGVRSGPMHRNANLSAAAQVIEPVA
jgi:hypothetical protein